MSRRGVALLLVMAAAGLAGRSLSLGEQCFTTLQAPEGSPWKAMGVAPSKVSLSKVARLAEKYDLKLEKGTPPPLASQARVTATCEHLGDMWMALPSPAEDDSPFWCWTERLMESIYKLVGQLKKVPDQHPDSPPRKYMKNYCGKELPVASVASDAARRMGPSTMDMHNKLRHIMETMKTKP